MFMLIGNVDGGSASATRFVGNQPKCAVHCWRAELAFRGCTSPGTGARRLPFVSVERRTT